MQGCICHTVLHQRSSPTPHRAAAFRLDWRKACMTEVFFFFLIIFEEARANPPTPCRKRIMYSTELLKRASTAPYHQVNSNGRQILLPVPSLPNRSGHRLWVISQYRTLRLQQCRFELRWLPLRKHLSSSLRLPKMSIQ
jgi:hypothetical protein